MLVYLKGSTLKKGRVSDLKKNNKRYILLNLDKYFFLREELNIFEMISMMLVRQGIID